MDSTFLAELREMEAPKTPVWFAFAACIGYDPEIFHPGQGESHREAFECCNGYVADLTRPERDACPVRSECLEFALERHMDHGVWGGTSERRRRRILKARRAAQ